MHEQDGRRRRGHRLAPALVVVGVAAVAVIVSVVLAHHHATRDAGGGSASAQSAPANGVNSSAPSGVLTVTPVATSGMAASPVPSADTTPAISTAPTAGAIAAPSPRYVRYTVKPGDNLWVIADWFHQQGFQPIYQWNRTTIGQDPSLIRPGQVLIVAVEPG